MSGFNIDWLDLRESADRRARDKALREGALQWLQGAEEKPPQVVDLGAGTGSTLRALEAPNHLPLSWRLVDHDPTLLDEARRRHGSTRPFETCIADLSLLGQLPLGGARLVTASALFDLVSADFIEGLAALLQDQSQQRPVGLYAALNYDGTTQWTPAHPLDDAVLEAFNRDQRRDKGLGPALGPESGDALRRVFTRAGFSVTGADSPWVLAGDDQPMVVALIDGIASAVAGSPGLGGEALGDWIQFRRENANSGTCRVGHTDLLALPV